MIRLKSFSWLLPLIFCAYATTSLADSVLEKIKQHDVITVGHRESSMPFSYYDNNQNIVGYSQEYSDLIVERIKTKLNNPNLKVKFLPITSQNRIPLIQNGTYDFECGSTTNNKERAEQVNFSNTIFIVDVNFLVNKDSGIKTVDDLKNKTVSTTAGTTSEKNLHKLNKEKNLNMKILTFKEHIDGFRALETGRSKAFLMDNPILAGERAISKNPNQWVLLGDSLGKEAYGCMLPKGDDEFKVLVDEVIAETQKSGKAAEIYNKWFTQPIPPKNVNFNLKLSPDMQTLFAYPNDRSYQ